MIKNILSKKISFEKIQKVDVLIFGSEKLNFASGIKVDYYTGNKIFFRYAISFLLYYLIKKTFSKSLSLYEEYFYFMVRKYDCKVAVGDDRNFSVFKCKKLFPNIISIAYQFGYWFPERKQMGQELLKDVKIDYYLMFDDRTKKFSEEILKTNYIISGSVAANEKKPIKHEKKYDFMFISSFRAESQSSDKINIRNTASFFLSSLSEYCETHNKTFCVAKVYSRLDKMHYSKSYHQKENNFIKHNAKKFHTENIDSFELAEKSKVCICTHSNLGYQLLARGHKVLFLNSEKDLFIWHFIRQSDGIFWYKGNNKKKILEKFDNLLKMENHEWLKIIKSSDIPMKFDNANTILKQLVLKLLRETK